METLPKTPVGLAPGTEPAIEGLVRQWEPLALRLAHRFCGSAEREDLEQIARFALWQAARRFDPRRGARFPTFAVPTIMGSLRRFLRDQQSSFRVRRSWWELRPRLRRAADRLTQAWQREPTVAELAEHLGVTEEEVAGTLALRDLARPLSLDAPAVGKDEEAAEAMVWQFGSPDPEFEAAELRIALHEAIGRLSPELRQVIEQVHLRGLSPHAVARRGGWSRGEVFRLERRALATLREALRDAFDLRR